jgi:DNA-binding FadR family transcriptional regulator
VHSVTARAADEQVRSGGARTRDADTRGDGLAPGGAAGAVAAGAVTGVPARRGSPVGSKLAAVVADRIVADVVERGWPVGEVLGSEAVLLRRYGVSRAVFREAVRLVEHQQVARMRRGPGGGLVVTEPSVESVIDAVVVYLCRADARLDDVFDARLILEEMVAELAPSRLEEDDLVALRDLVEREARGEVTDHRVLHQLLAAVTRNPALDLFVEILNRVTVFYVEDRSELAAEVQRAANVAHARIAEAVMAGNEGLARSRMHKHLVAEDDFLRSRRTSRQTLHADYVALTGGGNKGAEVVAEQVLRQVVADGWPVGQLLGSESDLIERYDVSRAVLREAVRLLEYHRIAAMRRGPGGGLFVTEPGVDAVTDSVALLLDRRGMGAASLAEVRAGVELAIVDRVIADLDDEGVARLEEALEVERATPDEAFVDIVGHDMHAVLARLTGNPVLELVTLVLIRLTRLHQLTPSGHRPSEIVEEVTRAHGRIVEAIVARDRDLAHHRMRRHLDALRPYFS